MTDDIRIRQQAIASIIKGVAMKTSLIVIGAAAAASVYSLLEHPPQGWWFLPFSILFGGGLGLLLSGGWPAPWEKSTSAQVQRQEFQAWLRWSSAA